jgi:hypothetical protein
MFVRRGMEGMPQREHGQTVNQPDLFQGASVTAEGVFELTVLMVISVFARPTLKEGTVIVVVQVHFRWLISTLRAVWNVSAVE